MEIGAKMAFISFRWRGLSLAAYNSCFVTFPFGTRVEACELVE